MLPCPLWDGYKQVNGGMGINHADRRLARMFYACRNRHTYMYDKHMKMDLPARNAVIAWLMINNINTFMQRQTIIKYPERRMAVARPLYVTAEESVKSSSVTGLPDPNPASVHTPSGFAFRPTCASGTICPSRSTISIAT